MKSSTIYVGTNGVTLNLQSCKGIAVFPARKGSDKSYVLTDSGEMKYLKGSRINGVGVPRFLRESGFELAAPGDKRAAQLADLVDVQDGISMVERATQHRAAEIQQSLAGQDCTFVPFDVNSPIAAAKVAPARKVTTTSMDLRTGFSSGCVEIEYVPGSALGSSLSLASGWIVGADVNAGSLPRNTDYGGLVELAVYIICNAGLGALVGSSNLEMDEGSPEDAPYPRGMLSLSLAGGDLVQVGITSGDELEVRYLRGGEQLYARTGMTKPRLAEVVGCIAAVLVRVSDLDSAGPNLS
ncbi:MAG: hypothetical protein EPN77_19330 [Candidimonas sp.]|nr:MAG: hypothetical protein EPN77_19330 [Candidimonas sp.]